MVKIRNNKILITRGDTLETKVSIMMRNGEEYIPSEEDQISWQEVYTNYINDT